MSLSRRLECHSEVWMAYESPGDRAWRALAWLPLLDCVFLFISLPVLETTKAFYHLDIVSLEMLCWSLSLLLNCVALAHKSSLHVGPKLSDCQIGAILHAETSDIHSSARALKYRTCIDLRSGCAPWKVVISSKSVSLTKLTLPTSNSVKQVRQVALFNDI